MRTGCLSHPANAQMMKVHQWQVDMLNGDISAAKLMSFFEYWHDIKLAAAEMEAQADVKALIQHHSEPELEAGVFADMSRKTIRSALRKLIDLGVVTIEQNPYNPYDRTKHFLFHPEVAQSMADSWSDIYQPHQQQYGARQRICVPGNLTIRAIGNFADCNRQNCRMHPAVLPVPSGQIALCSRQNCRDPKITSKITSKITNPNPEPPLPPNGGNDGEPPWNDDAPQPENLTNQNPVSPNPSGHSDPQEQSTPEPHVLPQPDCPSENRDAITTPPTPSGEGERHSAEEHTPQKVQKKKNRMPALTATRLQRFKALWNEITADVSWYASWGVTDTALEDAVKVLWSSCQHQAIDAFDVFEVALSYACTKSPFWGRPPDGGGKWTPIKLLRKKKGHVFSLYAEATSPDDTHPYPHLRNQGLAEVWVGPGEFDFDADLMSCIQKSRAEARKPHDLGTCVSTILWMIDKNQVLLKKCWQEAIARKEAIQANQMRRQMTLQDIPMPVSEKTHSPSSAPIPGWVKFMRKANLDVDRAKQMYLEDEFEKQSQRLGLGRSIHPHWVNSDKSFDELSIVEKEVYLEFLAELNPSDLPEVNVA